MVTPDTPIRPGANIVRVGADDALTRKGRLPVFPVIHVIWPAGRDFQLALSFIRSRRKSPKITLLWHDREEVYKPGKKQKYLTVMIDDDPWFTYRVPTADRELFQRLHKKWGMWFLHCAEQNSVDDKEYRATVLSDGIVFTGNLQDSLHTAAASANAKSVRRNLESAYDYALEASERIVPGVGPAFAGIDVSLTIMRIPQVLEEIGGELPWDPKELEEPAKITRDMHDDIVDTYLGLLELCNRARRGIGSDLKPNERTFIGRTWRLLRDARIFEISPHAYGNLYHAIDVYVTEKLNGLSWVAPGKPPPPDEEVDLHIKLTVENGKKVVFPENLPFDICWLAFGGAVIALTELQKEVRGIGGDLPCVSAGYLITAEGLVQELILADRGRNLLPAILVITHREPEHGWLLPNSYSPWIATWLIRTINSHQHTVVTRYKKNVNKTAKKFKRAKKKIGIKRPVPPMFYAVYMKDEVIHRVASIEEKKERERGESRQHNGFSHRWDRRGSYCYRICRGDLPMPEDMEAKLKSRGYTIYKNEPLDRWAKNVLKKKGVEPKLASEWMAIREWWRRATICGPEDKPYRPSTRRGTKGVFAAEDRDEGARKAQ